MNKLSKYRSELFGIATIGIVLNHYQYFAIGIPRIIATALSYGGSGVYIFVLLSGLGLYYSLSSPNKSLSSFYKKRAFRIFIPYFLIAGIWYLIKYLIILKDPINFIYELSTVSFWLEHRGAWYVAMLIPVYLVFPFIYLWIEQSGKYRLHKTVVLLTVNLLGGIALFFVDASLFDHLRSVWCSLFFFIIGEYIGKPIRENNYNDLPLLFGSIIIVLVKMIIPPLRNFVPMYTLTYALSGVIMAIILSRVFSVFSIKVIKAFLRYIGRHSLEMYLSNLVWIQFFQFFKIKFSFDNHGLFTYGIILLLGFVTSILVGNVVEFFSIKRKMVNI